MEKSENDKNTDHSHVKGKKNVDHAQLPCNTQTQTHTQRSKNLKR